MLLKGKNVVVGVTGGIAVYKAVEVVSRFKKLGADVYVIMTKAATEFVQPMTFQSISHNPVVVEMFGRAQYWDVEHISLADKADLFLIAPATANIIGKIKNGIADDMLSTTVMATKGKVVLAPAMNVNMYHNPIVQENMNYLRERGYRIIEADAGYLACGYEGLGRFPKPAEIVATSTAALLAEDQDLLGRKVMITAGGTQEPLDPVRFLSNHSSGKMGYALARIAAARGAEVTLISAPSNLTKPKGVERIDVRTAAEMAEAVFKYKEGQDVIIMAAAVADYRPKEFSNTKIKKKDGDLLIELERTEDILARLGKERGNEILVGFAAESDNLLENAQSKLKRKKANLIVANDIGAKDTGFAADDNQVVIIGNDTQINLPKADKLEIAMGILDEVVKLLN
ncbi:bifunctional phosphopantothenoylcysteine decarboxylase/phosphopantothenate--cysteine ligase CoaBC [Orenia metallireducens]|uniref:bifunctional phosphopantothenoylcysteine decarboxylase/phosphopantothenate--cysteine ligase CoaBC n=1 Tax=Orenia metallireducens TaxID=1413210 RepID=UPI000AEDF8FD|nr:bifunctional phosphopantothenoylcysteine decarboxylase/phosphopantothenate--cysteine ligase CoaBC [Orenia metallireducens]